MTVTSPGLVAQASLRNAAADVPASARPAGAGASTFPNPSAPWTTAAGGLSAATSGVSAPRATGMSGRPTSST
jgi:hypothetical protein